MKITIDGKILEAEPGKTILEVCKNNGIEIPALCFLEGFEPYGGCLLCVVEVENLLRLVPSCGTKVMNGMVIHTNTPKVREARKLCLELLLSAHWGDCLSPCKMNCPAGIDVEGYIRLIREGNYEASYNLIMENLPFPSSVGRVCPAFCEENCRRNLKEGPLAIRELKRFVGDWAIKNLKPKTQNSKLNGKKIGIIGGGPAGLSCAYYLAKEGYSITIFEKNDKLGGMLRYGIPEYRLPKEILDAEINRIVKLGIEIKTNRCITKDEIVRLKMDFDAIFIGIGCQKDIKLGIAGEDLSNVISGIKLLRDVACKKKPNLGKNVCIIGGGNTAIDCARTSLRLGADRVSILYRRGRDEMPASKKEIKEAEEEGVKIEFLVAPNRVFEDSIECIRMELGEPDSSGRRKPIPISGSEFKIKTDTIITAIGQRVSESYNIGGNVFAGGDCVSGPATVVEAIASGKKGATSIMDYLNTEDRREKREDRIYNCVKEGILPEDIITEEQIRYKTKVVSADERKKNFQE
ncbi:MAG: FAD-dependent oxidoreductase, partial [bacterium]